MFPTKNSRILPENSCRLRRQTLFFQRVCGVVFDQKITKKPKGIQGLQGENGMVV